MLTLWTLGFILAIVVSIIMYKKSNAGDMRIFIIPIILSIIFAEGIAGGWWITQMINSGMISEIKETGISIMILLQLAVIVVVPISLVWCMGAKVLYLDSFKLQTRLIYFAIFIISMILWVLIM